MIRVYISLIVIGIANRQLTAQTSDSTKHKTKTEKIKTGWNFGVLPAIAFDSDLGFQYGALANFYHYGDGSVYPMYKHSLYFEWSRTTKGSGTNQFTYDSKYLIPHVRVTADFRYLTEKALDFFGFNGNIATYQPMLEDVGSASYISKMFYRQERKQGRIKLDFQGNVLKNNNYVKWHAGYIYFNNHISTVDINNLNKGKSGSDILPDTALLYDKYIDWQIIPQDEKNGGVNNMLEAGIIYDTRDNEPNPMKGMWSEALLISSPGFLGNKFTFNRISITHRQYFTIRREVLNFAYRVSYQGKLSGHEPFYLLPFQFYSKEIREGLGGAKTIRGMLRNRFVGENTIFANFELRWKFFRTIKFNQNFYSALTLFTDIGKVTGAYSTTSNPEALTYIKNASTDMWHNTFGAGLYFAMNQNFVAAFNYGVATDKNEGKNALYIGLNFLY